MRGLSNSKITRQVLKSEVSSDEVSLAYKFARLSNSFVQFTDIPMNTSYRMECLDDAGSEYETDYVSFVMSTLDTFLWHRPTYHDTQYDEIIARRHIAMIWTQYDVSDKSRKIADASIEAVADHERCLIHGDPTWSNTMRRGGQLVLIDPLPCKAHVPSVRAIDISKVRQSMLGWDMIRDNVDAFDDEYKVSEAVKMMTVYTLLRIWPYIKRPCDGTVLKYIIQKAVSSCSIVT